MRVVLTFRVRMRRHTPRFSLLVAGCAAWLACACSDETATPDLLVYSGRGKALVQPLIDRFEAHSGLEVEVRYGGSAQMAAAILDEGEESPADVYYGQDAGALGSLAKAGRLSELPAALLDKVEPRFRARDGRWIGASGRARVLVYNTSVLREADLPDSVLELTEPRFKGRIGWAPTNGSFQVFVTAMRLIEGEQATRDWLAAMVENESKAYRDNTPLFEAVLNGEIDIGLSNHYYLFRFLANGPASELPARNYSPRGGGAGALINIAGAGVLTNAPHPEAALDFAEYLLSNEAQRYFANETFEYPLVELINTHPLIEPLSDVHTPDIDLSQLDDLEGTLALLHEVGAL